MKSKRIIIYVALFALLISISAVVASKTLLAKKPLYVALGDSVAAGLGLKDLQSTNGCGRTKEAYSYILATEKDYRLENLACSGATINKGILGEQKLKSENNPSQLSQLAKMSKPKLITITIGANDINWTEAVNNCFTKDCGSDEDTATVTNSLLRLEENYNTMLSEIQALYSGTQPEIVITTYYDLIGKDPSSCTQFTSLTETEINWFKTQSTRLNDTIQTTAKKYPNVKVANVDFDSNGVCSQDSWIQGVQSAAPLHPTAKGQQAIKDAIAATLQ